MTFWGFCAEPPVVACIVAVTLLLTMHDISAHWAATVPLWGKQ